MKPFFLSVLAALVFGGGASPAQGQGNLVTNGRFSGANPLLGWRVDFPWEAMYKENAICVKVVLSPGGGSNCVLLDLPAPIAMNQGGKIESDFLKVVPGASYHAQIECRADGLAPKLYAEVWAVNPKPTDPPTKYEVPARNGLPALVTVYRAQLPDPAPGKDVWRVSSRDFTVPAKIRVAGQEAQPAYITLKAIGYGAGAGKIYFRDFQLLNRGNAH